MDNEVVSTEDVGAPQRVPSLVRAGCATLVALGVLSTILAGPSLLSPSSARCSLARQLVDDANTDGRDWNDVDTGGTRLKDLSCAQAIGLAERIPEKEDSDRTVSVPGEGAIRVRGAFAVGTGIGQALTGFFTLRNLRRRTRTAALVLASLGIVFPVLGIISAILLVFVAYAIGFSSASQQVWPRPARRKTE
ncbi:MAG TPA: hypothetical protein VI854_08500 [Acidimicrobiia bacterium]|nr:hypothetical protein [Acidimicrobiia bacterium]